MNLDLVMSPSEFVDVFNQTIDYAYPRIVIEGEISSFRIAKNRWLYFDIKDESATIRCFGTVYVLPGPLEDGMMVQIVCTPRLHPQFNFSLQIQSIVPKGEGAIARAADLLFKKLDAEGIFSTERKRSIPYPPSRIALVTSIESAAYADYVKISGVRWPQMQIDAYDVLVQGTASPDQIVARISEINQSGIDYDAVVVIRGGGSAEDLSVFSDERVVRAIVSSRLPTCVAIGHEVDESLSELACDLRASTPSNLAELMLPDRTTELQWLKASNARLAGALTASIGAARVALETAQEGIQRRLLLTIQSQKEQLAFIGQKIALLNPQLVLRRGYSLVTNSQGVVKKGCSLKAGEEVAIIFEDITRKAKVL